MKGRKMQDDDLRLVQVFLSNTKNPGPGIYEVLVDKEDELRCTCPGFISRKNCKHVRFVKSRIEINNGNYPLEISDKATQEDANNAQSSNRAFREFVIRFGRIEVY